MFFKSSEIHATGEKFKSSATQRNKSIRDIKPGKNRAVTTEMNFSRHPGMQNNCSTPGLPFHLCTFTASWAALWRPFVFKSYSGASSVKEIANIVMLCLWKRSLSDVVFLHFIFLNKWLLVSWVWNNSLEGQSQKSLDHHTFLEKTKKKLLLPYCNTLFELASKF